MQAIFEWFSGILQLLSTFKFNDFLDILIIATFLYGILRLVRDTRAEQLLKGIVLILVFYALARVFDLTMVTTLLKAFLDFSVVIIIVVFQPEIRKALEQLGRTKFSQKYFSKLFQGGLISNSEKDGIYKAISDVTDTAMIFSKTKTGALFVFEKDTKLTDIASTGTIINADTSAALLGNIFFINTPLHDGACIIRGGKIFAAGCILPLNREDVSRKDIGTRHRAAIGMSENSDAIIVIVSEETGTVSIALNGVLTSNFDHDSLVTTLEDYLIPGDNEKENKSVFGRLFKKRKEKKTDEE